VLNDKKHKDMSPIHNFQDLTIDLSRLGALELLGEPLKDQACIVKLAFSDARKENSYKLQFSTYMDAQRMYDRIAERWMDFERNRSQARLLAEAERELHF
jgi:hypothetical protein